MVIARLIMSQQIKWRLNDHLSKSELTHYGPSFLRQQTSFCNCSKVDLDTMYFSLKCISDLICSQKFLRLPRKYKNRMRVILEPYKNTLLKMSNGKKRKNIVSKLRSQSGGGIFTGLVLALIPLVSTLVTKLINKNKK